MTERDELKSEATELGVDFKGNISNDKLKALVIAAREEAEGDTDELIDDAPESPAMKPAEPDEEVAKPETIAPLTGTPAQQARSKQRQKIKAAKKRSFALSVVTITNRDNRENDIMTSVYLSFENQHFGLSKHIPLDVPVQVEQALIDIAESTSMTLHRAEIVNGKPTGNKIAKSVKKFSVSYARNQD